MSTGRGRAVPERPVPVAQAPAGGAAGVPPLLQGLWDSALPAMLRGPDFRVVDGNDVFAVWAAAADALARARCGEGPSFIEAKSYRLHGHLEAEAGFVQGRYRSDEEIASWRARDPIPRLAQALEQRGWLGEGGLQAMETRVAECVDSAVRAAEAAPLARADRLFDAAYPERWV